SDDATIKVKTEKHVIYTKNLEKTIKSYTEKRFDADEVKRIAAKIVESNIDSKENRKEHVQAIHTNVQNDKKAVQQGICPKCGGQLVERKGKYGAFTGCSNYPKCRYTVNNK
ncbi:MAG: topoisomerase DNA-binding C4 zinc finger domain-containing protein, partial [bacterium]|nr:topoisomerase DNA-binding C4 zinc finger domain-containing protein [bacterium]